MPDVITSRWIRELILRLLSGADGAGIGLGMTWTQIRVSFNSQRREISESDLRRELNDLVDDRMIAKQWDEQMHGDMFRMASRGREFVKAEFPWERIDEFTGGRIQ